ncbi:hypothetical protein [Vitreimonas flagellata]|uniref:hypothetical protein n=1 Tax=Vitreimonas flagellata TaxID=2560861 RepID=UPI001074FCC5|nr:hypothetical protein [Vitreimonas flagellata]
MPKLSRRTLIGALPLAVDAALHPRPAEAPQLRPARIAPSAVDDLLEEIRAWIQTHTARDAMVCAYSDAEGRLFLKAKALGLSPSRILRSNLDDARALKVLNRDIKSADRKLDRAAARIAQTRPQSLEAAMAQIDMGLLIQGPYDWDDHAYALIQSGRAHLWQSLAHA